MKEVDQSTGEDLNPPMVDTGAIDYKGNPIKVSRKQNLVEELRQERGAIDSNVGSITGILVDSSESRHGTNSK